MFVLEHTERERAERSGGGREQGTVRETETAALSVPFLAHFSLLPQEGVTMSAQHLFSLIRLFAN